MFGLGLAVVLVVAGGAFLYRQLFTPEERAKRALGRRPRSTIADNRGGVIRVTGRVRARGKLLRAPVSGRSCVAYRLQIDVQEANSWTRVVDTSDVRSFAVVDDTGEALVDTSGPIVILALERDREGTTGWYETMENAARKAVEDLLESRHISLTTWIGTAKKLRYSEGVLEEGELVSVGGVATREVDARAQPVAPRALPTALVLRGTAESPLLISDAPEAHGEVS